MRTRFAVAGRDADFNMDAGGNDNRGGSLKKK